MFRDYSFTVAERFLKYVTIDTQSDPNSTIFPSTEKQKDLSQLLVTELRALGITDAHLNTDGYVFATIPSNTPKKVPVICYCAHVDTSPDASGKGVKPIIHRKYDGSPITLPEDPTQVITLESHPYLAEKIGDDIITASGTTLLGADDKSGVAIIMDMACFLMRHPQYKHGTIKILFTPDEEVDAAWINSIWLTWVLILAIRWMAVKSGHWKTKRFQLMEWKLSFMVSVYTRGQQKEKWSMH